LLFRTGLSPLSKKPRLPSKSDAPSRLRGKEERSYGGITSFLIAKCSCIKMPGSPYKILHAQRHVADPTRQPASCWAEAEILDETNTRDGIPVFQHVRCLMLKISSRISAFKRHSFGENGMLICRFCAHSHSLPDFTGEKSVSLRSRGLFAS
jgi:hypothetical protein